MDPITATPAALALLDVIVAEHGPMVFHQSGGRGGMFSLDIGRKGRVLIRPAPAAS